MSISELIRLYNQGSKSVLKTLQTEIYQLLNRRSFSDPIDPALSVEDLVSDFVLDLEKHLSGVPDDNGEKRILQKFYNFCRNADQKYGWRLRLLATIDGESSYDRDVPLDEVLGDVDPDIKQFLSLVLSGYNKTQACQEVADRSGISFDAMDYRIKKFRKWVSENFEEEDLLLQD